MSRTVDLVIAGGGTGALSAAAAALERGWRVLVLLPPRGSRQRRRFRRRLGTSVDVRPGRLVVMADVEVVCVDGIDAVEAVVIRHARTGRVTAVNASVFIVSSA